jgi:hypothetical protein
MKFILLLLLIIAVLIMVSKLKVQIQAAQGDWPLFAKKPLSEPEQQLYFRLQQAMPEHIVLAHVPLSCLLDVKNGHNYRAWFKRMHLMQAQFVVCDKESGVLAVIELDDVARPEQDRGAAEQALSGAGIRVLHWQAKALPDPATIRSILRPVITLDAN